MHTGGNCCGMSFFVHHVSFTPKISSLFEVA